jgi:hypothetical protein
MGFETEPTGYEKTALSDLQGAWTNLRNEVVKQFGFPNSHKLLFHIDEAMSWESVRDLSKMKLTLLIIQNITAQVKAPEEVREWVHLVRESLDEAILAIKGGEAKLRTLSRNMCQKNDKQF